MTLPLSPERKVTTGRCRRTAAESRKLLFLAKGEGKETLQASAKGMREHGADAEPIERISMDMGTSYIFGAKERFLRAEVFFLTASPACRWRERPSTRCAMSSRVRACRRREASGLREATNGRGAESRRVRELSSPPPTRDWHGLRAARQKMLIHANVQERSSCLQWADRSGLALLPSENFPRRSKSTWTVSLVSSRAG
nr:transposase [Methylacidimicrobium sp. AP8]